MVSSLAVVVVNTSAPVGGEVDIIIVIFIIVIIIVLVCGINPNVLLP